jgi:hypothetical protein
MEKRTYQDLMRIYQEMYQVDEEIKKLPRREMRKGEGLNNYSGRGSVQRKTTQTGTDTGKTVGGDGKAFAGKGKFANNTPWTGAGAQKSTQNDTKSDDKRSQRQRDQAKADRKAAAMDRRREGSAKPTKLDNLLKDIKGE